jgi:hypothetical protein
MFKVDNIKLSSNPEVALVYDFLRSKPIIWRKIILLFYFNIDWVLWQLPYSYLYNWSYSSVLSYLNDSSLIWDYFNYYPMFTSLSDCIFHEKPLLSFLWYVIFNKIMNTLLNLNYKNQQTMKYLSKKHSSSIIDIVYNTYQFIFMFLYTSKNSFRNLYLNHGVWK